MSAKKNDKKVKVYGNALLRSTRFKCLPFSLLREEYYKLKTGTPVELPEGFVKNHPDYFIKD